MDIFRCIDSIFMYFYVFLRLFMVIMRLFRVIYEVIKAKSRLFIGFCSPYYKLPLLYEATNCYLVGDVASLPLLTR